jgi:hypothetical protein
VPYVDKTKLPKMSRAEQDALRAAMKAEYSYQPETHKAPVMEASGANLATEGGPHIVALKPGHIAVNDPDAGAHTQPSKKW